MSEPEYCIRPIFAAILLFCIACDQTQFTDKRDGKTYKITKIGEQVWMAENLNYETEGSKCYNDSTAYCDIYGRLYNLETAMRVCPSGWHLPRSGEWDKLINAVGGGWGGRHLKAVSGWQANNGTDAYGFAALPGGGGNSDGSFSNVGTNSYWWVNLNNGPYYQYMYYKYWYIDMDYGRKNFLLSVRCVQNSQEK